MSWVLLVYPVGINTFPTGCSLSPMRMCMMICTYIPGKGTGSHLFHSRPHSILDSDSRDYCPGTCVSCLDHS